MEVDIKSDNRKFLDGCCFMEVDIEATTDSFRMVAVLWRWILKRQPKVLGWLLFYGGGY